MTCNHYCNTIHCATCIRAFWAWAERWTRGRPPKSGDAPSFYVADNAVRHAAQTRVPDRVAKQWSFVHGSSLKARYAERLARGVCVWDDKKVVPGTRFCRKHNRKGAR